MMEEGDKKLYSDVGLQLIRSLLNTNEKIPSYNHELIEKLTRENHELYEENLKSSQSEEISKEEIMKIQQKHAREMWNKRTLLAYGYERLKRMKNLRWEFGNNLPEHIVKNLSKEELEWYTKYNDNLFNYMSMLNNGEGWDLSAYPKPPRSLYVRVKCLIEYGQFVPEVGEPIRLKKDSTLFLPLNQCEKLILQGVLEQV